MLLDTLRPWHDFFALVGAAAATLIGLLFVAASVGAGVYTREKHDALRAFLSPSVVHFCSVLAACLVAMTPLQNWQLLGLMIGGIGLFGFTYATLVWRRMVRHQLIATIDAEDRAWYAAFPALSHLLLAGAGITLLLRLAWGCGLLAVALGLLLLVGIRNAWDMTLWTVMRPRG